MTIAQLAANPDKEYRAKIFRYRPLTPFGIEIRITRQ